MRAVVAHAAKDLRIEELPDQQIGEKDVRVRIAFGGVCGSDLHYFNHGGFGQVRLREPMVLGHEVAGIVEEIGREVRRIKVGDRIAVSPSQPCNQCRYCLEGQQNQCLDMRFYGSAMRFPHIQGAFRETLVCRQEQAHVVAPGVSLGEAAMAEPLAVCLHAARRAGPLLGKRVLVIGAGPIGALCVAAARRAGAAEIVITDIADGVLDFAARVRPDRIVNTAKEPDALSAYAHDKGYFDTLFEASGAAVALRGAIDVVRPGGALVQVGLGGDMTLPINVIVAKELQLRGTFRFHEEFATAVEFIGKGLVDVKPLISATLPFVEARQAFELAGDRSRSMKVQLQF
ncbi:MAG TPA: L-idonate 5-dehydrogenase [Roseiarcus sp.]|nr:L-idonate 5-dehydrogenase [Roseiarcus sp.]